MIEFFSRRKFLDRLIIAASIVTLAVLFSAMTIRTSFQIGRLSSAPGYDDVVYFLSATRLLEAFHQTGLTGFAEELRHHGLHSPFSSLLALAAFASFGYQDWAPYAFDSLIIIAYLAILAYFFRGLPLSSRIVMLIPYLALPFATLAVVEFRPDLCWAVVIGFCAVHAITCRDYFSGWRSPILHGLLFGLALLIKPSTFAITLVVFGYSAVSASAIQCMESRANLTIKTILSHIGAAIGLALILATPYWIPYWAKTWHYFWANSFGKNREIWETPGDFWHQANFYFSGPGAQNNLGYPGLVIVALSVAASFMPAIRSDRILRARTLALWGVVALSYAINSLAGMKSPFLAGALYGTLIISSAFLLNQAAMIWLASKARSSAALPVVTAILAVTAFSLYHWPDYSAGWHSEFGANHKRVQYETERILERARFNGTVVLLSSQAGPVVPENVLIWLIRHGVRGEEIGGALVSMLGQFKEKLDRADLVIAQEPNTLGATLNLPAEPLTGEFLELVRSDPRFALLGEITAANGQKVYLFQRQAPSRFR